MAPWSRVALLPLAVCGCTAAGSASSTPTLSTSERLVAGGTARALSQLVMYPADALRTLAQTRAGARSLGDLGAKTLVSGCLTTSSFAYAIGALQFAVYGGTVATIGPICASISGAAVSCLASVPQEVIKQRLVTGIYPNFGTAVRTIMRTSGPAGFYVGWLPTVSRNIPFVVCTFTTFAALERRQLRTTGATELGFADSLRVGVLSALAAAFVTQPFDVVKTRMMTQAASSAAPYKSVADCVRTMWRVEGPTAFYAGLKQRSAYSGPLWALQFAANGRLSSSMLARKSSARRRNRQCQ